MLPKVEHNPVEKLISSVNVLGKPFSLSSLPEFPYSEYTTQSSKYQELESWFNGQALSETQSQGGNEIDVYPLRVNPIRTACLKHSYALFGEFPDDISGTLVQPRVIVEADRDKSQSDIVEDALSKAWYNNNGAAVMMENGLLSQIFGGCIFKASWVPDLPEEYRVRIERIHPREFVCVPYENDYWRLKQAWVVRKITKDAAEQYGVKLATDFGYYIEWWREDEYQIMVDDNPIVYDMFGAQTVLGGRNPFGFVPFVYIPHERAGEFYGNPVITDAGQGLTKELNLRTADAGDATSDQSHSVIAMRNVRGTPKIQRLSNGVQVIDLGSAQNITGAASEPDLFSVTRSQITDPMLHLSRDVRDELRRELMVPAVAEGEDEGSQRSAATLVLRMWPLTSHIKSERALWSTGLTAFNKMLLSIMANKKFGGINKEHLKLPLKNKWYPILPRDRQAFVEELVARRGVQLGSLEHLLALIGDVEDIDVVMEQINEEKEFNAEMELKAKGAPSNGSESDSGGPSQAQRNGGRSVSNQE